MTEFPPRFREFEFARAHFLLEFQEPFHLARGILLRLRKDLHRAARMSELAGEGEVPKGNRFAALFDPPLTSDPVALRRFQRPGPPFVLLPPPGLEEDFLEGDILDLPVIFLGNGIRLLGDFARTLKTLGNIGLHRGEGRFELSAIEVRDVAGRRLNLWQEGQRLDSLAPAISDARWHMEQGGMPLHSLCLEFLTPARLLSGGRPLFRADFGRLFPFILRRVASMAHAHCGVELIDDPGRLLAAAREVRELDNRLVWEDWRLLEGPGGSQDLGGLGGHLVLGGEALNDIFWVVYLGSLLNLGKSAAYGSGQFRVMEAGS
jgi:hypothetical protein